MSKKKDVSIYDYDVYFKLKSPMIMAVSATSGEQAKLTALRQLCDMPREELCDRFLSAVEIDPDFEIDSVECLEECSECFSNEEKEELIRKENELNPDFKL